MVSNILKQPTQRNSFKQNKHEIFSYINFSPLRTLYFCVSASLSLPLIYSSSRLLFSFFYTFRTLCGPSVSTFVFLVIVESSYLCMKVNAFLLCNSTYETKKYCLLKSRFINLFLKVNVPLFLHPVTRLLWQYRSG